MKPAILKDSAAALRRPLLRWYRERHRRLPWRETRDPYAIWVAEVMLQQTRSETVLRYYARFLKRFPTVRALAAASESRVLALWSGLGYYARARNLRRAARLVVERHGESVPRDLETLRALPGIGRYTAAAVASIAFGDRVPVVDGNVSRVFARLFDIRGDVRSPAVQNQMWDLGKSLLPQKQPGDWNQALMELGATICLPSRPKCPICPTRGACAAYALGAIDRLPTPLRRPPSVKARRAVAVIRHRDRTLLVPANHGSLFRGLWEFPGIPVYGKDRPETPLRHELHRLGLRRFDLDHVETIRHTILNQRITTEVFRADLSSLQDKLPDHARWFSPRQLRSLPLSSVGLKIVDGIV